MYSRVMQFILVVGIVGISVVRSQDPSQNSNLVEITEDNVQQILSIQSLQFEAINDVSWSSDASQLAVATETGILIFEVGEELTETAHFDFGEFIRTMFFIPNSSYLAVNQFVYDTRDFSVVKEFDGIIFDVSHQGNLLAIANSDQIQLYDLPAEEIVSTFTINSISLETCETACYVADITISPDDTYLAFSTPLDEDGVLMLEELNSSFLNTELGNSGLRFDPSNSIIAAWEGNPGFLGDKVVLTSVSEQAPVAEIDMCGGTTPDFSRNGNLLVIGSIDCNAVNPDEAGGVLAFFNVNSVLRIKEADLSSAILSMNSAFTIGLTEFSPNYIYLATTDDLGRLTLFGVIE